MSYPILGGGNVNRRPAEPRLVGDVAIDSPACARKNFAFNPSGAAAGRNVQDARPTHDKEAIAVNSSARTIAIGDIHGCAAALAAMVAGLELEPRDTVVMLGDAIDRGPDSRGVLDQLLALSNRTRVVSILGNHEQMLLDALDGKTPLFEWLQHGGAETLDSYGQDSSLDGVNPAHIDYIRSWADHYETPGHFFAHGNYLASRPLNRQPWADLRWQSLNWHTPGPHCSGKTAILGHTSQKNGEILNLGHIVCIDTFCCGGFWLSAFDVETGQAWQANEAGEFRRVELPAIRRSVHAGR